MKRLLVILFLFSTVFIPAAVSQEKKTGFLFEEYQDAMVHFKGGLRSQEKVNYNLIDGKLYFIDKKDGFAKTVSSMDNIAIVKIGERNFIAVAEGMQEVMPTIPSIYVQYMAKKKKKAPNSGYGGTSETSAITTYTEFREGGAYSRLKDVELEVTNRYNFYWIEKGGKKRQFADFKQFLKIYPKHREILDNHIKSNHIDFDDVQEIVNLCLYAESLYN